MGVVIYNTSNEYTGFLGNVMFQTAATVGIAIKNGMRYHNYHKEYFDFFRGPFSNCSNIQDILTNAQLVQVKEKNYHYDQLLLPPHNAYVLSGAEYYEHCAGFQSKKYWEHCQSLITELFTFKDEIVKKVCDKYKDILSNNPVSIHLRRGDFLKWPDSHPVMPLEYYNKAIALFPKTTQFLVFSNDIPYIQKHFIASNFTIVDSGSAAEDMCLMSMCSGGNILANSSFSIWASYLNNSANKKVVAPIKSRYYGPVYSHWNLDDLYEESWIQIKF